ncbi:MULTISPECIES: sigma factor-like helix-turn-helix DNA-binding protein [unclassified Faecalibacterium]|nr:MULTISPECIES: sigma factor-like helix-turn-helix DNA-binding protein [unclassified Faecalibacterium]
MASKNLEMGYLLDFYGEVLTDKQREMMSQYYHDDLSLSEIGENFGITRQGARDAIKHGESALLELEQKVGFAARYRRVQQTLEQLEQLVIDARFECTGPHARLTTSEYVKTLNKILALLRSIDEVNES